MFSRRMLLGTLVSALTSLSAAQTAVEPASQPAPTAAEDATVTVTMKTSLGEMTIELNREKAPISVENFLRYVDKGHFNGTVFHRVIEGFMVQGGGFDKDMNQKQTEAPIKNEWKNGLKNVRGSIAMARLGQRPDSATAQFFINTVDNGMLDQPRDGAGYAVFGKVTAGLDVLDKIAKVKTGEKKGHQDVPIEPVEIIEVKRAVPAEPKPAGGSN